jgi:alkanesulfonate monooxygenase SsuD/methylene tetrahydromethanopterin reductase-like flavin-dependent oxidoreductase (luciferase family)
MLLGYSLTPFGHHPLAWRKAREVRNLTFDALLAQVNAAEDAGFDFVLLADRLGIRPVEDLSSVATPFEPSTLASALATKAQRIGFVVAAAMQQREPYNLARRFASLDTISRGRSGWLAISSTEETARETEYRDLVSALWDSWEDDAFVYDKQRGRFFEPDRMHVLHHAGEHFSVRGPLNVNRSPQGKPVLAQLLNDGGAFAANSAELVLIQAKTPESLTATAANARRAAEALGRGRSDVRLLANIVPIVAGTVAEAERESEALEFSEQDRLSQPLSATRLAGTPDAIADRLEEWMGHGDLDGFTILPPTLEIGRRFLTDVVPELRRRGQLEARTATTLRERLGLQRPAHPTENREKAS